MNEIWKDIVGYEGYYQVSNFGRIKSLARFKNYKNEKRFVRQRIRKPVKRNMRTNYLSISLMINTEKKTFLIHRLVAQSFIPNKLKKRCINHIDGDPSNNRVNNLEWCTYSENTIHAYKTGLKNRSDVWGEKQHLSKLNGDIVRKMREEYSSGTTSYNKIGKKYGIHPTTAYDAIKYITWKHIT